MHNSAYELDRLDWVQIESMVERVSSTSISLTADLERMEDLAFAEAETSVYRSSGSLKQCHSAFRQLRRGSKSGPSGEDDDLDSG
jgi:hypothetical protein